MFIPFLAAAAVATTFAQSDFSQKPLVAFGKCSFKSVAGCGSGQPLVLLVHRSCYDDLRGESEHISQS